MTTRRTGFFAFLLAAVLALAASVVGAVPAGAATPVTVAPLPAKTYVLSSYYGPRCMPVRGASAWHLGQDMGAASGTDIDAIAAGTVTRAGAVSGFGQWVVVEHTLAGKKVSSVYGHVIDGDRYVKVGSKVKKGQHIADVGSSGTSTAPHLHLEIWKGSYGHGATAVDPLAAMKSYGVDLGARSKARYARTVPSSCTYYTTTKVNLRTGPSTGYAVARVVPVNGRLTAKPGASSGSWRKVTYGSTTGWMSASYVSPSLTVIGTRYVQVSTLNVRASASTSAAVVTQVHRNSTVGLLSATSSTGWVRVKIGTRTGYVAAKYLATTRYVAPAPAKVYSYVTVTTLNLRKAASTSSTVVAKLSKGTRLEHVGTASKGWLKVKAGTRTGYVSTQYISSKKP